MTRRLRRLRPQEKGPGVSCAPGSSGGRLAGSPLPGSKSNKHESHPQHQASPETVTSGSGGALPKVSGSGDTPLPHAPAAPHPTPSCGVRDVGRVLLTFGGLHCGGGDRERHACVQEGGDLHSPFSGGKKLNFISSPRTRSREVTSNELFLIIVHKSQQGWAPRHQIFA